MTSVAYSVSPILHKIDNHVEFLKRGRRGRDSEYRSIDRAKRGKTIKTANLGISEEMRCGYLHKGLGLNDDEVVRLRKENTDNLLLNHKKLHLVLDLDHTLLNTTSFHELSTDEEYLKSQTQSEYSLQHVHVVDSMKLMTKFRPYVRTFLIEASQMFELSIYTMGDRDYALEMARLLDPANQLFSGRVKARSDSTEENQKSLDVLLARDSAVVILDDTVDVWNKDNQDNVIEVPRYHFFRSSCQQYGEGLCDGKSFSESNIDERDRYGVAYLATALQFLKNVHTLFFNEVHLKGWELVDRDVRPVLRIIQQQVLKGCIIVFSHVFPSSVKAETHHLWKMAEQLGATCSTQVDASVTHVVAANAGTQKSKWAVQQGKFLLNPQWLHTAKFMWLKQPESNFPCQRYQH